MNRFKKTAKGKTILGVEKAILGVEKAKNSQSCWGTPPNPPLHMYSQTFSV